MSNFEDSSHVIELRAKPVSWRQAYSMKVNYGTDFEDYKLNHHDQLRRRYIHGRQDSLTASATAPAVSTPPVSTVSTVESSSQVVFPTPTTTPGPEQTSVVANISKSFVNAQILPIDGLNGFSIQGSSFPSSLALDCQNCTFTGNLQLTSGSFSTNSSNDTSHAIIGDTEEVIDFIESGYILVQADDLFAHVELRTAWPAGFGKELDITLLDLPLTPFTIPGIAAVGPQLLIQLLLSAQLSGTANLTYGFEVTVPNNSTALANIGQVNASSVTGFGDTNFTALPFGASIDDIALNLSATIRPEVLVGISFLDGEANAGAGVFLNLPTLALSVEQVSDTDEKCNPTTNQTLIEELDSEYAAMINIVPNVAFAAGVVVQAKANIPSLPTLADQRAFTPLATSFTPTTACLGFDKSAGGFVSPTVNKAAATDSGSSPGSASSSSASSGGIWQSQRVIDAAVFNAIVVSCMMLLGPVFIL